MIRLSASSLARAEKCPASATLPRVRMLHADGEAGTAEHAALEAEHPEGAEMAFALNPVTGTARFLGQGLQRAYDVDYSTEIPGTADHVEVEPERVVVTDHKTGFGYMVAPARRNLQLAHNALAAAFVHGKDAARVIINRTATGAQDVADLDAFDLAAARERIANIWRAALAPEPAVVVGDHCWRCECVQSCPAHLTMAVAFNEGRWPDLIPSVELTAESVAAGWERLKVAKRVLGLAEKTYRAFASAQPVPLDNGKVLGAVNAEREELDGHVTRAVLRDLHGPAVADAAVELSATKAGVERALATIAPPRGKAKLVRDALAAIGAANGIKVSRTVRVEEYQPGDDAQKEQ